MDIKINYGDLIHTVGVSRVEGRHSDIVDETKAHGAASFGMMPRRADGTKRRLDFSAHHFIDSNNKRARTAPSSALPPREGR